ncbi:MAG: TonB-dependent receptor [Pseudomonadota bacterium]
MPATRAGLLCAASGLALIATMPAAQDVIVLDEIVVTGELQDRTIQETTTSAVVETGEELNARGDVDIYDLAERTPNVSTTFGNKGFVLRGIQQNGNGSNGQSNGQLVSVQVDGAALANPQATFFAPYSTWDVDQFEILRGPQSTQQGRNALGGAVIINTNDPEFFNEFGTRVGFAERNSTQLAFMGNYAFSDTFAARFTAERTETDGYVENVPLDDDEYDAREYESYRLKFRWQPVDTFDAVLSLSDTESTGGEDYVRDEFFPDDRFNFDTVDAVEGSDHQQIGLKTSYELSSMLTLKTETTYYDQDYFRLEGLDGSVSPGEIVGEISIDGGSEVFEQDIQLEFESGRYSGVVGLFYTHIDEQRPIDLLFDVGAFLSPAIFTGNIQTRVDTYDAEVRNIAIYGETDIDLDDYVQGLTVTVGARYDYEELDYEIGSDYSDALNTGAVPGFPAVPDAFGEGSLDFDAFLPSLGFTYAFNIDQSVSFTIERGYRAGGAAINFASSEISEFDPEFTTNYEVAYRGTFNEDRVRVGANVYYTDWTDQQISVFAGTPGVPAALASFDTDTLNAAESKLYGLELSIDVQATEALELFAAAAFAQTEFTDFQDGTGRDFSGNEFPFAPNSSAAFGGKYSWENGFSLGLDVSWKDESYQDVANTYTDDERWLFNAQGIYDFGNGTTAGLYVRNLFDEDYATARFDDGANPVIIRTGEPRTIGFYVDSRF